MKDTPFELGRALLLGLEAGCRWKEPADRVMSEASMAAKHKVADQAHTAPQHVIVLRVQAAPEHRQSGTRGKGEALGRPRHLALARKTKAGGPRLGRPR